MLFATLISAVVLSDTACTIATSELPIAAPPPSFLSSFAQAELVGDWAFVPTNVPGSALNPGAVDVFRHADGEWGFHQQLLADIPGQDDMFGHALSAEGDRLLVGAPGWGQDRGAVYVFELVGPPPGQWIQGQRLHSTQAQNGLRFGWSCALSGQRALIGHAFSITTVRAVEVFFDSGFAWTYESQIEPSDPALAAGFGWAVALQGRNAVVGAHLANQGEVVFAGSALTFELGPEGWQHETTLTAPQPTPNLRFGYQLDLAPVGPGPLESGDFLLAVGRQCVGPNSLDRGFVFERREGSWELALEALPIGSQCFAASVAIDARSVAFGAPASALGGAPAGAVHLYTKGVAKDGSSTWLDSGVVLGSEAFGLYGGGCALDQGRLLAWSNTMGLVHDLPESAVESTCPPTANSGGPGGAELDWVGPVSLGANAVALVVSGAPPHKVGLVLGSQASATIPFGQGTLCLGPPTGRVTGLLFSDAAGAVVAPLDFMSSPLANMNLRPGVSLHLQYLFRDAAFGEGVNLSSALTLPLCP